jgi:hypothetical protein
MMKAASTSETSVNFYRQHGATTQKTATFTRPIHYVLILCTSSKDRIAKCWTKYSKCFIPFSYNIHVLNRETIPINMINIAEPR